MEIIHQPAYSWTKSAAMRFLSYQPDEHHPGAHVVFDGTLLPTEALMLFGICEHLALYSDVGQQTVWAVENRHRQRFQQATRLC